MGIRRVLVLAVSLILATSGCRWIVRASVDSAGNQANADSYDVALSADGRFVAFESDATNLVPNDTNGDRDVFVRDNRTGAVERVFETPYLVDLSEDGRYVAARDTANCDDLGVLFTLFLHDRQTGITECVNEGSGLDSAFSATMRFVASANGTVRVFDRRTGQAELIPVPSGHSDARQVDISDNGRYVAFDTWEQPFGCGLPPGPCIPRPGDVFVHDRQTGTTVHVPLPAPDGFFAGYPSISGNGRWVAYHLATQQGFPSIFFTISTWVYDRQTGVAEPVSVDPDGIVADVDNLLRAPPISDDGRFVAFASSASLDPENPSRFDWGLYVRDMVERRTTLINTDASGKPAKEQLFDLEIADDARYVAFTSLSANLVGGDTNGASDVFLRAIPLPRIDSVAPSSAARGTSTTITILGEGFAPQPTVQAGEGVSVTAVTRVSEHELSVRIAVSGLAPTGLRAVSVKNTGTGPGPAAGDTGACNGCLTIT